MLPYCCDQVLGGGEQMGRLIKNSIQCSFGDPYLLKHFFSVLSFPFSGSPVHSDPFRDLKFKNHRAF